MKKTAKRQLTPKQKKQQRIFFIVLAVIVLIALIMHFKKKKADDQEIESEIKASSSGSSSSTSSSSSAPKEYSSSGLVKLGNTATLKKGTKSAEVRWLQWHYNQKIAKTKGLTYLSEDGIFGSKTEAAVKSILGKTTTSWAEWYNKLNNMYSASLYTLK